MPLARAALPGTGGGPPPLALSAESARRVLVVDDSAVQRRILSRSLRNWGYRVTEAASGVEALELCRATQFELVLSDWMMPGMNGLDLCRAYRGLDHDAYGYFILLTSKSDKGAVALGLDVGADDFLAKPVRVDELRARINAGERLLRADQELREKNRLLTGAIRELRGLYEGLDRDLDQARLLQQSLLREQHRDFGGATVSLLLRPSGHIGGDLVGYFPMGVSRVGLFAIDVSGHGVTSALLTARIAGLFSANSPEHNLAFGRDLRGGLVARSPDSVARSLNQFLLDELETDSYLTLVYAYADLRSGCVRLVQAGHPHPVVLRADGTFEHVGTGGLPVGMFRDAEWDVSELTLAPGDRLIIMSDGITECPGIEDAGSGAAGLLGLLGGLRDCRGMLFLEALESALRAGIGDGEFRDDVSAVLFEYTAASGRLDPRVIG